MKGKHGAAAVARRSWAEVERERDLALQRASRAEQQLERGRISRSVEREAVARELQLLRAAATAATSPVVEQLRAEVEKLRAERDEAVTQEKRAKKARQTVSARVVQVLSSSLKISEVQAMDLIAGAVGFHDRGIIERVERGELTLEQALAIDALRNYGGRRNPAVVSPVQALTA